MKCAATQIPLKRLAEYELALELRIDLSLLKKKETCHILISRKSKSYNLKSKCCILKNLQPKFQMTGCSNSILALLQGTHLFHMEMFPTELNEHHVASQKICIGPYECLQI